MEQAAQAGLGGAGGNATSNAIVINVPNASVSSTATGGNGGDDFAFLGISANGGSANAQASGIARDQVTISATATGGNGVLLMAALPPYRAAASVRQFLAVRRPAALSPYQVLRLAVTAGMPGHLKAVPAHLLA